MDTWLFENLVCPRHHQELSWKDPALHCPKGCRYPVVDGFPVMLLDDVKQTMALANTSRRQANQRSASSHLYVESLGLTEEEKRGILDLAASNKTGIDPVVSFLVGATNGNAYKHLTGKLSEYPIPELRLPHAPGQVFLDVGCNWGRWCVAAARKGYKVVGIDPSLGAVMAARRVALQLGIEASYVVGDARFMPLKGSSIDCVFSYSVLQHLSREDVARVVGEISKVLRKGGMSLIQMPTRFGVRCLYHQARRRFRDGRGFEVRYWTIPALRNLFSSKIGPTTFSVDCFFGLGLQFSDRHLMSPSAKMAVSVSALLRLASRSLGFLIWAADSVYVTSIRASAAYDLI